MYENAKYIIKEINSMSLDEARSAIAQGKFGTKGHQSHSLASELVAAKEATLRDEREIINLEI